MMALPTSPDSFVLAAYGLAVLLIAGYGLTVVLRRRQVDQRLDAWAETEE
jgi:hypothetical protein